MQKALILFLLISTPLFAKSEVTPRCETQIEDMIYLALRGERAKTRRASARCLTKNAVEDLKLISCSCNNKSEAIACVSKVYSKIGISASKYLDLVGKKCNVDLKNRLKKNFPSFKLD